MTIPENPSIAYVGNVSFQILKVLHQKNVRSSMFVSWVFTVMLLFTTDLVVTTERMKNRNEKPG